MTEKDTMLTGSFSLIERRHGFGDGGQLILVKRTISNSANRCRDIFCLCRLALGTGGWSLWHWGRLFLQQRAHDLPDALFIHLRGRNIYGGIFWAIHIVKDGIRNKLCFRPSLPVKDIHHRQLLGVLHIEIQCEPTWAFFVCHNVHLLPRPALNSSS